MGIAFGAIPISAAARSYEKTVASQPKKGREGPAAEFAVAVEAMKRVPWDRS